MAENNDETTENETGNIISTFEIHDNDEQDAKRYRWLRSQHWSEGGVTVAANASDIQLGAYCPSGKRLDNLIDEKLNT